MNRLSVEQRVRVVAALCEGNSVRATCRLTGAAKGTVLKLVAEIGAACEAFQRATLVNLKTTRVEVDEIWAFIGAKAKNATKPGQGDIWTFTAIDADSKLMIAWLVGQRTTPEACDFLEDVASRLDNRVQLSTDGHRMYKTAVEWAFKWNGADYAQVVKQYANPQYDPKGPRRYSPAVCVGATKEWVMGNPDMSKVSTSYIERSNLTLRMQQRRFTRLTNAFSKKFENHRHGVSLFTMHYNFCRSHQTLTKAKNGVHTTPAMAAGVTDHVWSLKEIVALLPDQADQSAA